MIFARRQHRHPMQLGVSSSARVVLESAGGGGYLAVSIPVPPPPSSLLTTHLTHSTPLHSVTFLFFSTFFSFLLSHTLCFSLCLSFSLFHATTSQRRTKTTIRCLSESQRWIAKMLTTNVKRSSRIFHSRHRAAIRRAWKYYTPR